MSIQDRAIENNELFVNLCMTTIEHTFRKAQKMFCYTAKLLVNLDFSTFIIKKTCQRQNVSVSG